VLALKRGIGYINLPGHAGGSVHAAQVYVSRAYQQLSAVAPDARCGWVLDLRANSGGNVWLMVATLRPFLGEEPMEQKIDVQPTADLAAALNTAPVAVIIGRRTAGAGEGVALRFRGRQRSRIFGQPSAGQTTANRRFPLPDGSALSLAVRLMRDRTGRSYSGPIEPDVIALSPSTAPGYASSNDEAISAATRWLLQESRCGGA
jgi:C-terminal processing protease CtpA/Prc